MQVLPTTPCVMIGQVRVVMVVIIINKPSPFLPIWIRTKEVNYNHQPRKWYLYVNALWEWSNFESHSSHLVSDIDNLDMGQHTLVSAKLITH